MIETNITLTATGGTAAAAEIDKAAGALDHVGKSSGRMAEAFQHRFQHIGLMLFAGDALRASGLGAETRQVIQVLNLALSGLGTVAGVSAGGIGLLVTGLAALAGILVKVSGHHKDELEALTRLNETHHRELEATQDDARAVEKYAATLSTVPSYIKEWENAERSLEHAQVERQIKGDEAQRASLIISVEASRQRLADIGEEIAAQERVADGLSKVSTAERNRVSAAAILSNLRGEYDKLSASITQQDVNVKHLTASINLLSSKGTDDIKKLSETHHKSIDDMKVDMSAWTDEFGEDEKKMRELSQHAASSIAGSFSSTFARMIVEGKNFSQTMAAAFKSMATQIISDLVRIGVEWAILSAMGVPMAGAGGALAGHAKLFGGRALGGSGVVDRPTFFMAGEGGPEAFSFRPLAGGGREDAPRENRDGSLHIGSVETHVYGITDPDRIADEVGRKIVQRIRGAGQISFTRA